MTKVGVAKLKAELSHYLGKVRKGKEVVVYDRDTPIARLIPYVAEPARKSGLVVRPPRTPGVRIQDIPLPPPLPGGERIVQMLIAERQRERDRLP